MVSGHVPLSAMIMTILHLPGYFRFAIVENALAR